MIFFNRPVLVLHISTGPLASYCDANYFCRWIFSIKNYTHLLSFYSRKKKWSKCFISKFQIFYEFLFLLRNRLKNLNDIFNVFIVKRILYTDFYNRFLNEILKFVEKTPNFEVKYLSEFWSHKSEIFAFYDECKF